MATTRRTTKKVVDEKVNQSNENVTVENQQVDNNTSNKINPRVKIDMDELVTIKNATQGKLVIHDSDGFANIFEDFGYELEMEYKELVRLKKKSINMFRENYIEVEPSVAIALGVDKFYANSLTINEFDEIFNLELDEFEEKVSSCTHSVQQSIGMRAIKLIENGTLDSIKKINILEKILNCKLIED